MGATFDSSQVRNAIYWYEKVPYTYYSVSLPIANSELFSINDVLKADLTVPKLAVMSSLATTVSPGLDVLLYQQHNSRQLSTSSFPPSLGPILSDPNRGMRSTGRLGVSVANNSGAVYANYQANWVGSVKRMSTSEKLLFGVPLTATDQQLQAQYQLGQVGTFPMPVSRSLDIAFEGQILSDDPYGWTFDAPTSGAAITNEIPVANQILVITSIAAGGVPVGNQVTLNLSRDTNENYMQILADNMSLSQPFPCWIPVRHNFSLTASAMTATNNVSVRLGVLSIRLTPLIRAMFGELNAAELRGSDKVLFDQVSAGVIV